MHKIFSYYVGKIFASKTLLVVGNLKLDSNITDNVEKKLNTFIAVKAFSVSLEKLYKNSQACCPPQRNFVSVFLFAPAPFKNFLRGPCTDLSRTQRS